MPEARTFYSATTTLVPNIYVERNGDVVFIGVKDAASALVGINLTPTDAYDFALAIERIIHEWA